REAAHYKRKVKVAIPSYVRSIPIMKSFPGNNYNGAHVAIPSYVRSIPIAAFVFENKSKY
ncbi:hypothetical protein DRN98_09325, partial [Methanosarcinales archaeon]